MQSLLMDKSPTLCANRWLDTDPQLIPYAEREREREITYIVCKQVAWYKSSAYSLCRERERECVCVWICDEKHAWKQWLCTRLNMFISRHVNLACDQPILHVVHIANCVMKVIVLSSEMVWCTVRYTWFLSRCLWSMPQQETLMWAHLVWPLCV